MKQSGWIKIYRSLLDWEHYKNPTVKAVFLHLLLTAAREETQVLGIRLLPGECLAGRTALSKALGLTESQVRWALQRLERSGEITQRNARPVSSAATPAAATADAAPGAVPRAQKVVFVVKWRNYQADGREESRKDLPESHRTCAASHDPITRKKQEGKKKDGYTRAKQKFTPPRRFTNTDWDAVQRKIMVFEQEDGDKDAEGRGNHAGF